MKLIDTNLNRGNAEAGTGFKDGCRASCRKILARTKAAIFAESQHALQSQERLLQLALNEAEAAAWQTGYPHLLFPALATEKVQTVIAWDRQQQSVRRANPVLVLAA